MTTENAPEEPLPPKVHRITALIERIRDGDQEAARILHDDYSKHILHHIRVYFLPQQAPLRRDMDSTDILQQAWQALFQKLREGATFASPQDFIRFMLAITRNQFLQEYRNRVTTAKRSLQHSESLETGGHDLFGSAADPARVVADQDDLQQFFSSLSDDCQIVTRAFRDGESLDEIARQMRCSLKNVQLLRRQVKEQWECWKTSRA